ncbi:uncharacterized protein LOC105222419 [Bactrocera dorsalis]|uniref:Uncharacterized protein LOC105222419 n=1 Tax=Bactrocera dorsalis TaxID=27457 RepID=A0A6I9V5U3_BACDO|nr:uncharacterized protein LOC105222419 [Bactrocera dorsalis]
MDSKLAAYIGLGTALFIIALLGTPCTAHSSSQTTVVQHSTSSDPAADGFWKRNVDWKSRWVKYWRPKAIYVPIWKKVWTPVVQNEWVPLPKVPPGWEVRKDGVSDSTNSGWKSSSSYVKDSSSSSSSSSGLRTGKSYSGWSSGSSSSYGSSYSSSGSRGWQKGVKRTRVREVNVD